MEYASEVSMEINHHRDTHTPRIRRKSASFNLWSNTNIATRGSFLKSRMPGATLRTSELQRNGKVLVIDSNKDARLIIKVLLSSIGHSVLSAANSDGALEIFLRNKSDIRFILSDFSIPHLNGMEILQEFRKIVPGIPVILSSGYLEEYVVGEDFRERPTCFLKKPYDFLALKHAIDLTLNSVR